MNVLLDTNVLSEVRRPAPDSKVLAWLDAIDEDRAFISVTSIAELRRGIALTPVKFGISFTATHFNQAGALIHVYADGSIQLNRSPKKSALYHCGGVSLSVITRAMR